MTFGSGGGRVGDFLLVAHGEIVVAPGCGCCDAGAGATMICCWAGVDVVFGRDLHVDVAQRGAAGHAFHRAGVGHDDDIVLVGALKC